MDNAVVEKIQKLLARGDEARNDNPHEREIAMRHAHALLAKHGLQLADVTDAAEMREHMGRLGRQECQTATKFVWESGVWNEIARLNGCKVLRALGSGKVWVVGRELRAEVVKSMSRYCVGSIRREGKRLGFPLAGFGSGAWTGIAAQVSDMLRAMESGQLDGEQVSTGTALILVSQHKNAMVEADAAVAELFRKTRSSSYRITNHHGYSAGKEYGKSISLNQQLGGGRQQKISAQ